jgi:hypothetical protein
MRTSVIYRIAAVCLLVSAVFPAFSRERTLTFGGKNGWQAFSRSDNIAHSTGAFGHESIEIASNAVRRTGDTDLLLDFEGAALSDTAGNYTVTQADYRPSTGIVGKSGAITTGTGGIRLKGAPGSIFGSTGLTGSFTTEFWLKPAIVENGEILISWRSSHTVNRDPLYQRIRVYLFNNRINWSYTNIFDGYTDNEGEVTISSSRILVPEVWTHHRISFDDETGMLQYQIDGKTEAIRYMTTTGTEYGDIYQPVTGGTAELEICPGYTGAIDDFRITRGVHTVEYERDYTASAGSFAALSGGGTHYNLYDTAGGRIETMPARVIAATSFASLSAVTKTPQQTAVQFFVRAGGDLFNWNDNYPEWVPVEPGKAVTKAVTGEYFQVAAVLYPDGAGRTTPSVTEIALTVREELPPLPPIAVRAEPRDGAITVSWLPSTDILAAGYLVYYGERPGEYLGAASYSDASPVNAGSLTSITLSGLQNGKIYYVAVASYSKLDGSLVGELSTEVFARPLKGKGVPNE